MEAGREDSDPDHDQQHDLDVQYIDAALDPAGDAADHRRRHDHRWSCIWKTQQIDTGIPYIQGTPALSDPVGGQPGCWSRDGGTVDARRRDDHVSRTTQINEVPLIGSLPIIGNLFKERTREGQLVGAALLLDAADHPGLTGNTSPQDRSQSTIWPTEETTSPPSLLCHTEIRERLKRLRKKLTARACRCTDRHTRRERLLSLADSRVLPGALLVEHGKATLFTDGRYTLQAPAETALAGTRVHITKGPLPAAVGGYLASLGKRVIGCLRSLSGDRSGAEQSREGRRA